MTFGLLAFGAFLSVVIHVEGHVGAWHKGMYCLNGNTSSVDLNTNNIVNPLYQLSKEDWWFHHVDSCDNFPPAPGDFLDLPAGQDFTVQLATNRAQTTFSYNGQFTSDWPDGHTYPDNYNVPACITQPNMHTQNQSMAAGTAFAISYQSDIKKVTSENLVVFSVRLHTPWKRVTSYSVPAAMPACPPGGCICAWGWVPNGCGQPNMYHQAFKCQVTGATSTTGLATPKPPVWCEDDPSKCVKGAKQMIYWNQKDGNNIAVSGFDLSGAPRSPAYNAKCGFSDGAQNDIFLGPPSVVQSPPSVAKTAPAAPVASDASKVESPKVAPDPQPTQGPQQKNGAAGSNSQDPPTKNSSNTTPPSSGQEGLGASSRPSCTGKRRRSLLARRSQVDGNRMRRHRPKRAFW